MTFMSKEKKLLWVDNTHAESKSMSSQCERRLFVGFYIRERLDNYLINVKGTGFREESMVWVAQVQTDRFSECFKIVMCESLCFVLFVGLED